MKKMKQLTYHHIRMKKDGGDSSRQNGALLSAENHQWFHKQSEHAQGYMNAMFQEYKRQVDECEIVLTDNLDLPFTVNAATFSINGKELNIKYNRAKEKKKLKRYIDKYKYYDGDFER